MPNIKTIKDIKELYVIHAALCCGWVEREHLKGKQQRKEVKKENVERLSLISGLCFAIFTSSLCFLSRGRKLHRPYSHVTRTLILSLFN